MGMSASIFEVRAGRVVVIPLEGAGRSPQARRSDRVGFTDWLAGEPRPAEAYD